jgi:hypothetical protein
VVGGAQPLEEYPLNSENIFSDRREKNSSSEPSTKNCIAILLIDVFKSIYKFIGAGIQTG